ncbi:hypothetical protein MIND_00114100 [Mycena indigotica]|uniref:Uncharacterized protein n=1 Tax=Mycena indigotica TaxID=2126181 RepID=A0A8H6TFX1_9AGAR|nr:uncharacterized protein MIND_00114100 [Mycena indigotica]KAF7315972.1 hypothetical protein MIND_00114100 [Mycena indigotica]
MSFAPNESAAALWNERSILAGLFLGTIGFGIHLTLFFECVQALCSRRESQRNRELLVFVCLLFTLGNIGNATNIIFAQKTFIDNRNYPGGPNAFFVEQSTNWSAVVCNSVYIVNSWFQDALLVYRFWMIYNRNYYIIALPIVAFLSSMVLSSILIAELSQPGKTIWTKISVNLAIPYWSISISMTVILTALIAGRLLYMRYRLRHLIGRATRTTYMTVSAMLVESAMIYSANALVFLISYGVNSPVQNLALPLLGQTQSIAPLLIILRVARGKAWSGDTTNQLTSVRFAEKSGSRPTFPHGGSTTILEELRLQSKNDGEPAEANLEMGGMRDDETIEFRVKSTGHTAPTPQEVV